MNIFLASDLHFDTQGNRPVEVPANADIVVLAGDIDLMPEALQICADTENKSGKPVIFVPGNHEFHDSEFNEEIDRALNFKSDNVHVLLNKSVIIDDVKFIGSTLWTNFLSQDKTWQAHAMSDAESMISDFRKIRYLDSYTSQRYFSPSDALRLCKESQDFICREIEQEHTGPTVVVTHFSPSPLLENKNFSGSNLSPYFNAECSSIIEEYSPELWLYGHTHDSTDRTIGKTRFCSNQGGIREDFNDPGFRDNWIIRVGDAA